ncbi:MAG: hypothetical protein HY905_23800 [Deltaproteobacteria bacterium]|nr:hypothetical protein [Deltaproteobacteria bacterium]
MITAASCAAVAGAGVLAMAAAAWSGAGCRTATGTGAPAAPTPGTAEPVVDDRPAALQAGTTESAAFDEICAGFPSSAGVRDAEVAVRCSYAALLASGLEAGFSYDGAEHVAVRFPSGDEGAVVAIGFSGIVRGYIFLYRIHADAAELVDLETGGQDWGIRSMEELDAAPLETVPLFASEPQRTVVKVTGAVHPGTGLWAEGYFELREVTEDGLRLLFAGAEVSASCNEGGFRNRRAFNFEDLDADGTFEIVAEGADCALVEGTEYGDCREGVCEDVRTEHQWNGERFGPPGPGTGVLADE